MHQPASIIIPSFKKDELLKKTLKAVTEQVHNSPYDDEVLVIDDGGYDTTVIEQFDIWHLLRPHEKYRLASNCNFGLEMASNPIIIKIDADCVPQTNWLNQLRKSVQPSCLSLGRVEWIRDNGEKRKDSRFDYETGGYRNDPDHAPQQAWGGNLATCKRDLLELGGWTEAYDDHWGSEEADLGWHYHYSGKDIKFVFESLVVHQSHDDSRYRSKDGQQHNYEILKERKKQYKKSSCDTGKIFLKEGEEK